MAPINTFGKFFGNGDGAGNNNERLSRRQRKQRDVAKRAKREELRDTLEKLEQRWLPAVSVTENPTTKTLTISYGASGDDATITGNPTNFTIIGTGVNSPLVFNSANNIQNITVTGQGSGFVNTLTVNGTTAIQNPNASGSPLVKFTASGLTAINLQQMVSQAAGILSSRSASFRPQAVHPNQLKVR